MKKFPNFIILCIKYLYVSLIHTGTQFNYINGDYIK